jgi:RNA polymerase sigma factor (sigma-70 family)
MANRSIRRKRPYVAAVLLGTALGALSPGAGAAAPPAESIERAVNDLGRYCTACWRNARLPADTWTDCTQEVLCRLLERVPTEIWGAILSSDGEDRRELMRAIDAVKKRYQRARKLGHNLENVADTREENSRALDEQRQAVREAAGELLSLRQQRILQLSCDGWTVAEIAARLRLPAERISDEKYKAIQRLRHHVGLSAANEPAPLTRLTA